MAKKNRTSDRARKNRKARREKKLGGARETQQEVAVQAARKAFSNILAGARDIDITLDEPKEG